MDDVLQLLIVGSVLSCFSLFQASESELKVRQAFSSGHLNGAGLGTKGEKTA
jgi:hypothetical protein